MEKKSLTARLKNIGKKAATYAALAAAGSLSYFSLPGCTSQEKERESQKVGLIDISYVPNYFIEQNIGSLRYLRPAEVTIGESRSDEIGKIFYDYSSKLCVLYFWVELKRKYFFLFIFYKRKWDMFGRPKNFKSFRQFYNFISMTHPHSELLW